jgi:hypothetical protein
MADRVMLITWGENIAGREERGLEVFNEAIGLYGRMQQDGRIEGFDVSILAPNGRIDGYIALRGSAEQLAAVAEDEEYQRVIIDASLVVKELAVAEGYMGNGLAKQIGMYQEALAKVPQHT